MKGQDVSPPPVRNARSVDADTYVLYACACPAYAIRLRRPIDECTVSPTVNERRPRPNGRDGVVTSESASREDHHRKFQELLRELFQFDCADLDFGIYRIMNHKRDAIERFIGEELPARIAGDLDTGQLARQSLAEADLEKVRQKVLENFGRDALDADGKLDDKYSGTPRGEDYLRAKAAAEPGHSRQAVEADTYNHLFSFFNRYYRDGEYDYVAEIVKV